MEEADGEDCEASAARRSGAPSTVCLCVPIGDTNATVQESRPPGGRLANFPKPKASTPKREFTRREAKSRVRKGLSTGPRRSFACDNRSHCGVADCLVQPGKVACKEICFLYVLSDATYNRMEFINLLHVCSIDRSRSVCVHRPIR